MGYASRNNPTAVAAKKGELPPKKKSMSKREHEEMIMRMLYGKLKLSQIYDALKMR